MTSLDPVRAHRNTTIAISCALAALGGLAGAAAGGWIPALVVAAMTGGGSLFGGYLVRHRALAAVSTAEQDGAARGFAEGLAHGMIAAVAMYEAAVFPATPDGVTPEERAARRTAAYRLAAETALPEPVRQKAAAALAALDDDDLRRSQDTISSLFIAVHRQTTGR